MKDNCPHSDTELMPWPDGGVVEFCRRCGYSRSHWEQGESPWIFVDDIEQAREDMRAFMLAEYGMNITNPESTPDSKPAQTRGSAGTTDTLGGTRNAVDGDNSTGPKVGSFVNIESSAASGDSHTHNSGQDLGAEQHEKREGLERVLDDFFRESAPAGPRKGGGR